MTTKISERSQQIRLDLIDKFLKIEGFVELGTETQLAIIDKYYNYVLKGEINDDTEGS